MDKLKTKARSARNRVAERTSQGTGSGSLSAPHSTLPPSDNASTTGVNEGFIGPQPGTSARDFAASDDVAALARPRTSEPPTSLQASVDAGTSRAASRASTRPRSTSNPVDAGRLQVPARGSSYLSSNPSQAQRPTVGPRQPSIGVRRMPSTSQSLRQSVVDPNGVPLQQLPTNSRLPAVDEDRALGHAPSATPSATNEVGGEEQKTGRLRGASIALRSAFGSKRAKDEEAIAANEAPPEGIAWSQGDFNPAMVDVLDTIDPEIQTLTSLTNVQNSLFIPNLGRFVNRRPTYTLRQAPSERTSREHIDTILQPARLETEKETNYPRLERSSSNATMATLATIDSTLSDSRFAVLPHGTSLEGWSKDDKQELNDHVRHMLHSRRSRFKRSMRGFGQYVRRPLGFLVTLYAVLITLFGLIWVLFLIGWINVGGRKLYIVNVIDNILVALFAIVGDGLAPFRAVDTYHMIFIAHYHHFTWSRRKKQLLPELHDHNDLPAGNAPISAPREQDPEDPEKQWEFTVLTPKQQAKLEHHTAKFCKSHSFYKPHETETHYAFPLRLLIAIVVLLDCHSLFQIALGTCTWAIYYKDRPFALTTVILCCSITCNATGGLLIWIGDHKTRKKDVLERMNRQELTEEAIRKVERRRERESESEREDNDEVKLKGRHSLDMRRHHHQHHHDSRQETPLKQDESAYP